MVRKCHSKRIAMATAKKCFTYEGHETVKAKLNGKETTISYDIYRKPNGETARKNIKLHSDNQKIFCQMKNLEARIQAVKIALSKLKEFSTTSERGDDYLRQLNYAVVKFREEAQKKKNNWSDLEVALTLKECENEIFSEFSETYTHELSAWIEDVFYNNELCGGGIFQPQPELEV